MNELIYSVLAVIAPHILEVVGVIVAAIIARAAAYAGAKWRLDIEQKAQDDLHRALMTGARMAIDRTLTKASAADLAIGYARASVPGAIRKLKPPQEVLVNLARAKVAEASK